MGNQSKWDTAPNRAWRMAQPLLLGKGSVNFATEMANGTLIKIILDKCNMLYPRGRIGLAPCLWASLEQ